MYFPYIRGKQFDLIAFRELATLLAAKNAIVSPVIEPIGNSPTLRSTIKELARVNVNFTIIVNPRVGNLQGKNSEIINLLKSELNGYSNFQLGVIVDDKYQGTRQPAEIFQQLEIEFKGFSLIHNNIVSNPQDLVDGYQSINNVENNVINYQKTSRRYNREFDQTTVVSLEDSFPLQPRNADYLPIDDSSFGEEHLFFKNEGIRGFSDFLTIGEPYSESGFSPYAIAIHISYTDSSNRIRVKHFVSDSNKDITDTAGKFGEALGKLVPWVNERGLNSIALNQLRALSESGHFPGLGSLKKLSMMHHVELTLSLL